MDGVMPGADFRPVRFSNSTGAMRADPLGWILHVAEGNGSPWRMFDASTCPNRKVSTGWVAKDGRVEQYVTALSRPWSQGEGNADYHGWETEGFATEPLTSAQIYSLAVIHNWHGANDNVIDTPGARGIGTHAMGGAAWGGHACPGSIRAGQRRTIISVAQQLRLGQLMPITDADAQKVADVVQTRYQVHSPAMGVLVTRDNAIGAIWEALLSVQADLAAIKAQVAGKPNARE